MAMGLKNMGIKLWLFLPLLAGLHGCTSTQAFVPYEQYHAYASDRAGNRAYRELGPISATHRGPLWNKCTKLTRRVMKDLNAQRIRAGGDALVLVQWRDHRIGGPSTLPGCTREWGWGVLLGVGALAPWAQEASARALIIRFEPQEAVTSNTP